MKFSKISLVSIIVSLILPLFANLFAQSEYVVLFSGILYKSGSREPLQTSIIFIDEEGNSIKAKSEINGQYQAILKSGNKYVATVEGYSLINNDFQIEIPKKKEYQEIKQNFELVNYSVGTEIFAIDAFAPNSLVVNSNALHQLLKLKYFLVANPNIKINIYVSAEDTYFAPQKKSKKVNIQSPLNTFLEKRASNLRDILTSLKIKDFSYNMEVIHAVASATTKKPSKGKKEQAKPNTSKLITLKVEISKITRL